MRTETKKVESKTETAKTTEAPVEAQPQAQGPDLTVQDLQALKSIIEVASSRGSFKPNEMIAVGQVYNKLEAFLEAVAAQQNNKKEG
jgi:hypothetical protein